MRYPPQARRPTADMRAMDYITPFLQRAQEGLCYLCGIQLRHHERRLGGGSRDHVHPRSKGGKVRRNILLAHKRCNEAKADRLPHPCELIYLDAIYTNLGMPG